MSGIVAGDVQGHGKMVYWLCPRSRSQRKLDPIKLSYGALFAHHPHQPQRQHPRSVMQPMPDPPTTARAASVAKSILPVILGYTRTCTTAPSPCVHRKHTSTCYLPLEHLALLLCPSAHFRTPILLRQWPARTLPSLWAPPYLPL